MNSKSRIDVWALLATAVLLGGCVSKTAAPVRDGASMTASPDTVSMTAPPAESGPGYYTVRSGDTLMALSRQFGQSFRDLAAWNNLTDPNQIHVGQQLRVAPPETVVARPISAPGGVEVVGGDALASGQRAGGGKTVSGPRGGAEPYPERAQGEPQLASIQPTPPSGAAEPTSSAPADTPWIWPASGRVLAGFSDSNKGVDISGSPGDPVIASSGGRVVYSGSGLRGYGKLVIIKHDNDFLTAYAHNQNLLVKEGDDVQKGQRIAELGSTDADRPKLHFEIRRQGKPVDPMKYLPRR